jgi:hypothetical protein
MTQNFMIFTLPQIFFGVIRSRRKRWPGHKACMGDMRGAVQGSGGETCGKENTSRT